MFREMRRSRQLLTNEECFAVLGRCTSGVLAVHGDDGYPYAVPLSYALHNGRICFHCADDGHKTDAIRANEKVSFCVVDRDDVIPEKYTTAYRSVIAFGRAAILEDASEKRAVLMSLAEKYSGSQPQSRHDAEIADSFARVCVVAIEIGHLTGKEGLELLKQKG